MLAVPREPLVTIEYVRGSPSGSLAGRKPETGVFSEVKTRAVEAVGGEEGLWAKDPDLVVCNGPFVLTEYESGVGLTLVKNEHYWNADD